MNARFLVPVLLPGMLSGQARTGQSPPAFENLASALVFMDREIDHADWKGLDASLYPPFQPGAPNRDDWNELMKERGGRRLAVLGAGEDFPSQTDGFIVRVSRFPGASAIGGSRIRLIKTGGGWRLNAAYEVR